MSPRHCQPEIEAERVHWDAGLRCVAGVDEAGRGAWAGPVVAGAVILRPADGVPAPLRGVRDSKLLTPTAREELFDIIIQQALAWGVGLVPAGEIDRIGILPATRAAMRAAIAGLRPAPETLLIDAVRLPDVGCPQRAIIRGDQTSLSIAAASIIAKVTRDRWMREAGGEYAAYGFGRHKGYGTPAHRTALDAHGPCPIHRFSFAPVAQMALRLERIDE